MDARIDTLFDVRSRSSLRWKRYAEDDYAYINQSGRPEHKRSRRILEQWFRHFPAEGRKDLRGRFRKGGKATEGAFFELLIHEFFRKLGCEMEAHPDVPCTSNHLDFLARHSGKGFYLESVARSQSESQFAHDVHTKDALDKLNNIPSPDFGVVVRVEGTLNADIPTHQVREPFLERLKQLEPSSYREGDTVPGLVQVEKGGWLLCGRLVRKSMPENFYPEDDEFILARSGTSGWDSTSSEMLKVLQRKARRYGKPELPIVIALNWCDGHLDEAAVVDALYAGHVDNDRKAPAIRVRYRTDTGEPVDLRPAEPKKGSGLFRRASGDPKYNRVAAVLVFHQASLYLNPLPYRLYLNDNATGELPDVLRELRHVTVVKGKGERQYNGTITISSLAGGTIGRVNSPTIPLDGKQVLEWHDGKTAAEILGIDATSSL